ncbi:MAG: hypothetical protein AAF290_16095 [Pseudomonadota bacterium]
MTALFMLMLLVTPMTGFMAVIGVEGRRMVLTAFLLLLLVVDFMFLIAGLGSCMHGCENASWLVRNLELFWVGINLLFFAVFIVYIKNAEDFVIEDETT